MKRCILLIVTTLCFVILSSCGYDMEATSTDPSEGMAEVYESVYDDARKELGDFVFDDLQGAVYGMEDQINIIESYLSGSSDYTEEDVWEALGGLKSTQNILEQKISGYESDGID